MIEKLPIELIQYSFDIANLQTLRTLSRTCSEFNIIITDILRNRTALPHTKKKMMKLQFVIPSNEIRLEVILTHLDWLSVIIECPRNIDLMLIKQLAIKFPHRLCIFDYAIKPISNSHTLKIS